MKQKHDELKAAIERGIVDNSKAVGKHMKKFEEMIDALFRGLLD